MPGAEVLLDSNVVAALLNAEPAAIHHLKLAGSVGLPVIVFGELYYGALNSQRSDQNIGRLEDFAATCTLFEVAADTARVTARVRLSLKQQGTPIPENDLWIAALALQHTLPLATRDGHFQCVQGLTTVSFK